MVAGTCGRKGCGTSSRDVLEFPFDEGKGGWSERVCFRTNGKGGMASAEKPEDRVVLFRGGCCCCLVGGCLDVPGELQKMDVSKAYLKLNTGEVIELDKYQGVMIREDSIRIANADYTLRYSYDSVVPLEVKYDTLMIPRGSEYSIVLTDGTKVFLNAGSEIYYPVAFSGDQREVGLKGEAYFEVAKDECRPFFVQAGDVRIRVLGTSFNVTSYPERERIETTLEQGRIQITNGKEQINVVPGKQVVYNKKNNRFEVKVVDTKLYTSWKDGYYKFDQMTLEEIMETLALWFEAI